MGLKEIYNNIVDSFAVSSTETISSSTIVRNAISNNLLGLRTNPKLKKIKAEYISHGSNDDIPEIIDALLEKSTTHSGIVRKKAKMVSGMGLEVSGDDKFTAFAKNAGGYGVTLYSLFSAASFFYEKDGGLLLVVDSESKTNQPLMMTVLPHSRFRVGKPDANGVSNYVVREVFKKVTSKVFSGNEEIIEAFDESKTQKRYGIYIKNPFSTNPFYGTPSYVSAFDFISADYEFGRTIYNSAQNGFAPRVMATFIGRNMSEEQKADEADKFKTNFNGADSENVVVSFVRREEEKPQFDSLDIQNLDKTIDIMAKLNDSKILTAHNVTSPTLFGIMVSGKLGGSGTELYSAYELFRATETLPNREIVLDGFKMALNSSAFKDAEITVKDLDMTFLIAPNQLTQEETEETEIEEKETK